MRCPCFPEVGVSISALRIHNLPLSVCYRNHLFVGAGLLVLFHDLILKFQRELYEQFVLEVCVTLGREHRVEFE
jgi:hypothetical protein